MEFQSHMRLLTFHTPCLSKSCNGMWDATLGHQFHQTVFGGEVRLLKKFVFIKILEHGTSIRSHFHDSKIPRSCESPKVFEHEVNSSNKVDFDIYYLRKFKIGDIDQISHPWLTKLLNFHIPNFRSTRTLMENL